MVKNEDLIPLEQAKSEVALVCRRLGLLHMAFAQVLVDEFGDERGKQLVLKAIKEYGKKIGEKKREIAIRQGLEPNLENLTKFGDLPRIGMHDHTDDVEVEGERRYRAHGCVMAKVWREYGKDDLGRIYCYVDPASTMAYTPEFKLVHTKAVPDGDEFCELALRPTTEKEREDFFAEENDWAYIDK
jgi:hypothetical protein